MSYRKMIDISIIFFLTLFTILFGRIFVDFSIAPFEDAAILMRYSEHIAQGYGIVWNVGDKPVDGATDFLFMLIAGLLTKAGLSLEFSIRIIGYTSHVLTVIIVYSVLRNFYQSSLVLALMSALYLASGPGLYYVAAYFGTPFFALLACITWCIALALLNKKNSHKLSFLFAISGLVMEDSQQIPLDGGEGLIRSTY